MVHLALLGFLPLAVALFALVPPRRAAIAVVLLGWMFLPMAGFGLPGLPDYDKSSATSLALVLGILLFDSARVIRFRFRLVDAPMIVWCAVPGISVIANSIEDGGQTTIVVAAKLSLHYVIHYGVFWFAGRLYFTKLEHLKDLAMGLVIAGLVYVPFCVIEMLLSPQLHNWVYGRHQHAFGQTLRFGGYRPMVFMQHGLMLGLFMVNAALVSLWLWQARTARTVYIVPMFVVVGVLLATAVLCRSTGAIALLMMGLSFFFASKWLNTKLVMIALLAIAPTYVTLRASGAWTGDNVVEMAFKVDEDRGKSLRERMRNENLYVQKARDSLIIGFAGWNRWQVRDPDTHKIITVPDGMWVIALGRFGLVGLVSFMLIWLLPLMQLLRAVGPPSAWWRPEVAPAASLAMVLALFMVDSLLNAMTSSYYTMAAGALAGAIPAVFAAARLQRRPAGAPAAAPSAPMQGRTA